MNASQFQRILVQTLLLPVLALAVVAGILVVQVVDARRTVNTMQISDAMIESVTEVQTLIVDEETGLRGYEITGDRRFLEPFDHASGPLNAQLQELRRDLAAKHQNGQALDAFAAAEQTWRVTYAEPLIAQIAAGGNTADVDLNLSGKQQMDALRARLRALLQQQSELRAAEVARWHKQVSQTIAALLLLALLAGAVISISTLRSMRRVSEAYDRSLAGLRQQGRAVFASEERLRTTLTSIADGVVVTSADGRVELLNKVAEEWFGYKAAEAMGKPLEEVCRLLDERTAEPVESAAAQVTRLAHSVTASRPVRLLAPDGTERFIDQTGAPIHDHNGRLTGVVTVFRDITSQREAQVAQLASEKLAAAGRLAASIAHEMHNPLDSVVNLLYLLRDEPDTQKAQQYLDLAQAELARMGQVSRAMLGIYRDTGSPAPADVAELVSGRNT